MIKTLYNKKTDQSSKILGIEIKQFHTYIISIPLFFGFNKSPKVYNIINKKFVVATSYNKNKNIQTVYFTPLEKATPILLILGGVLGVIGLFISYKIITQIKEINPLLFLGVGFIIYRSIVK